MGNLMKNGGNVLKGSLAIGVSDLIVFKGVPMIPVPMVQNNPMAVRLALSVASLIAASKWSKFEIPLIVASSHNLNAGAYTIQKVHDFMGIHSQIDQIASETVAAIEQGIADKVADFKKELEQVKETVNDNPMSRRAEDITEGGHELVYSN